MAPVVKSLAVCFGFVSGWLIALVIVYGIMVWIPAPAYTGDPDDMDAKSHLESLHDLKMFGLSAIIAIAGGVLGAVRVNQKLYRAFDDPGSVEGK